MTKFIIVEGPDGAGKTTLIEKLLASHPHSRTMHFGAPKNDEEAFGYWQVYLDAITNAPDGLTIIFDRAWYSDQVYGPVMRKRLEMTDAHLDVLEQAILIRGGGMVIYCTGNVDELWKRCTARGEEYVTSIERLKELHDKYEEVMKKPFRLPIVRYDTTVRW